MARIGDEAGVSRRVGWGVVEDEMWLGMGEVPKDVKEVETAATNDVVGGVVAIMLLVLEESGAEESFGSGTVTTAEKVNSVMLLVEKMSDEGSGEEIA